MKHTPNLLDFRQGWRCEAFCDGTLGWALGVAADEIWCEGEVGNMGALVSLAHVSVHVALSKLPDFLTSFRTIILKKTLLIHMFCVLFMVRRMMSVTSD